MFLCLDIGNSHVYGGVFINDEITLRFRYASVLATSDELGTFLRSVLRENGIDYHQLTKIAICSVVPQLDYSIRSACLKYFSIEPFVLQAGVKTGLNIKYRNPLEVGSDRIANAIAATHFYPQKNLIIIDFGTATTFCAISAAREYMGGVILAGIRLSMEALQTKTAKLPSVEILKPLSVVGRSTVESMQSGLYFGALGASTLIVERIKQELFSGQDVTVLATGGFAQLFVGEALFTEVVPDLVLQGLKYALIMNS